MNLDELLQRADIWRAGELPAGAGLASGFPALDAILPGGGWPGQGLTEILAADAGIGALRLVLPALAMLSRAGRWIIWVAPPYVPYPPALDRHGLDLDRVLVVDLPSAPPDEALWACEQALRFADCGAALLWQDALPTLRLRRLQLAAEAGGSWGLLFRPERCAALPSPAPLRLLLRPRPATVAGTGTQSGLQVILHKARGGTAGVSCELAI